MGYRKIQNLYRYKKVLEFDELFACEKVHGSSANVSFDRNRDKRLEFFVGGCKQEAFEAIFDKGQLHRNISSSFAKNKVVIFGEVYGGKIQKMSKTYGEKLKFIAFEVKIEDYWLPIPEAERFVKACGLEFVPYRRIPSTIEAIDKERDRFSEIAMRRGVGNSKIREGVVLYPLSVVYDDLGNRIIAKHKREEFRETKTKREVSPEKLKVLKNAKKVVEEWVTPMRLIHVLDSIEDPCIENMREIILEMIKDIKSESSGEVVWSKSIEKSIGTKTVKLFKEKLNESIIKENNQISVIDKIINKFKKDK